ncbi:MAG: MGMT family protein [Clostridia bacterium]|nr:MGMT family protein [Clostridia bacterium]
MVINWYNKCYKGVNALGNSFEKIYETVKKIPKGKVATYGQIATLAGNPKWSQVVGYALHANPKPNEIPCYRVVNRFGEPSKSFAFGGCETQRLLLEMDGIEFLKGGNIDLEKYQWQP